MVRSFVVLLLLIVVFLTGMLIGIDREQNTYIKNVPAEFNVSESTEHIAHWDVEDEEQFIVEEQTLNTKQPEQATQKVASFLEAGVKGFYEIIVEVLYQVSSLFV